MHSISVKRKWWGILAVIVAVLIVGLVICGVVVRNSFEPYIRRQAISYLQKRFQCDVQIADIEISIPTLSPLRVLTAGGKGTIAHVQVRGLKLSRKGSSDSASLLNMKRLGFNVDLGTVFEPVKAIDEVDIDGVAVAVPPKGQRSATHSTGVSNVRIGKVLIHDLNLAIQSSNPGKQPLTFTVATLRLQSEGPGLPMNYYAELTNPKPHGLIRSSGKFGPWNADEPGDTPISGNYTFDHADLSVFPAIAGILNSTGQFEGILSSIQAKGAAYVPDFRLTSSGNRVPLSTTFEVLVDGQNGNTILRPVRADLGSTHFVTSGAVLRKDGDLQREIGLDVSMPSGSLTDVLRLAMKGKPMMEGKVSLRSKIIIPPLSGKVQEKLILDGDFAIRKGHFLRPDIQNQIDTLSRRGQGRPKDTEISDVFSDMNGKFHLQGQTLTFKSLTFGTSGAAVDLAGSYSLAKDAIDLTGSLSLDAKVSQTMSGWKRIVLKPVDPFFAKNGAGTFLRIRIDGDAGSPHFGLDHGKPDNEDAKTR